MFPASGCVHTGTTNESRGRRFTPSVATWVRDALEVAYDHVRESLNKTAARRKRLYDTKAVNRIFPVGSWVLRYYPRAAQNKLGSPWIGPQQVVRQATGHTVGIQKEPEKPIVFVHVDDLKLCPGPQEPAPPSPTRDTSGVSTGCPHLTHQQQVPELAGVVQAFPGGG